MDWRDGRLRLGEGPEISFLTTLVEWTMDEEVTGPMYSISAMGVASDSGNTASWTFLGSGRMYK